MAQQNHTWLVTGPWYSVETLTKDTPPLIQKYDTPQLVNRFLKDPQSFLEFGTEDQCARFIAPPLTGGKFLNLVGVFNSVIAAAGDENVKAKQDEVIKRFADERKKFRVVRTRVRKLYLDTHRRFYLIICEIRCDAPGLPRVNRNEICRAGFVIRRKRMVPLQPVTTTDHKEAMGKLRSLLDARELGRDLAEEAEKALAAAVEKLASLPPDAPPADRTEAEKEVSLIRSQLETARNEALVAREAYEAWLRTSGYVETTQGWFPTPALAPQTVLPLPPLKPVFNEQLGQWQPLRADEETPSSSLNGERFYPLYPLIPDPRDAEHAGAGRTLYFAVIPTGSDEKETDGGPRFDSMDIDQTVSYHIRCFVQAYKPNCPRKRGAECHGPITWSLPGEPYKLASPFDVEGTSQNPVNIPVPNLTELVTQVASDPANAFDKLASVHLNGGPGSPEFDVDRNGNDKGSGISSFPTICFNSIPLITLVALFAFAIFLPIVLILFNAYWMLLLRFCIPPKLADMLGSLLNVKAAGDLFQKALGVPLTRVPKLDLSKLVKLAKRRARRKR